jgi:hypothetical protein
MQLPRGTFRSIRKNVNVGEILSELASSRFTGIGTLSSAGVAGTLVFKNGVCILAKMQDRYGDPAWDTVLSQQDLITDIALSDLDHAQLQLAIDFNKKARLSPSRQGVPKPAAAPPQAPSPAPPASAGAGRTVPPPKARAPARKEPKEREFIKTTPVVPVQVPVPPGPERAADLPAQPRRGSAPAAQPVPPAPTPAEEDLDTFEDMDLDEVAQKIRKDCKIILKQLQLDHLTEK